MRALICVSVAVLLAGCSIVSPPPKTDTFVVFFDPGSTELSAAAKVAIKGAADAIQARHPTHVAIASYPKPVADDGPDRRELGDTRFNAVVQELVSDGVDQGLVAHTMLTDLEVKTGPVGMRRVEIRLLGG